LGALLDIVASDLPTCLVDASTRAALGGLASEFIAVSTAGFEAVLGTAGARADLAIRYTPHELLRQAESLSRVARHGEHPAEVTLSWGRIEALMAAVVDPEQVGRERYDRIHELWLEFDVARGAQAALVPAVFLGLARWDHDAHDFRRGAPRSVPAALQTLGGGRVPASILVTLDRCFSALEDEQHIMQVGSMLSRPERGARIVVRGFDRESALAYLRRVEWPGDFDRVASEWGPLANMSEELALSLDVGPRVGPRLGIEASPSTLRIAGCDPRCARMLDAFVARDLCSVDEAAQLLSFCGRVDADDSRWPANLRGLGRLGLPSPSLARGINHFKLVIEGRKPTIAKAYFGFHFNWVHRGRLL